MNNELTPTPKLTLPNNEVNIHATAADCEFTATRNYTEEGESQWTFVIRAPIAVKEQDGQDIWAQETFICNSEQAMAIMFLFTDQSEDRDLYLKLYKIAEPVFAKLQRPFWLIP